MRWERPFLVTAAAYNAVWVAALLFAPDRLFSRPFPLPAALAAGVACVGACYAANVPRRRRVLLGVALASKAIGPALFLLASARGYTDLSAWWVCVANDVLWIPPTAVLLLRESSW